MVRLAVAVGVAAVVPVVASTGSVAAAQGAARFDVRRSLVRQTGATVVARLRPSGEPSPGPALWAPLPREAAALAVAKRRPWDRTAGGAKGTRFLAQAAPAQAALAQASQSPAEQILETVTGVNLQADAAVLGVQPIPPDPQIAAGPGHLVQMVNSVGRVWTRAGVQVSTFALPSFFGLPSGYLISDPDVIYDAESGLWYASAMAIPPAQNSSYVVAAVSDSGDPTGTWHRYTAVQPQAGFIFDFPRLGTSSDKVSISVNEFSSTTQTFVSTVLAVLDKGQLVAHATTVAETGFSNSQVFGVVPAVSLGATSVEYMVYNDADLTPSPSLGVLAVTGTPAQDNVAIQDVHPAIAATSPPPDAPQRGGARLISTNDDRLLSAVWQQGRLWTAGNDACVPPGDAVLRSCMRIVGVSTEGQASVVLDEDAGVAGGYVYYPALSVDGAANLYVVFSQSSPSSYAGTYISGISPAQPGQVQPVVEIASGTGYYDCGTCPVVRWGDYSGAARDPVDPSQVWVTGEFADSASAPGNWGTRIARISFSPSASGDLPLVVRGGVWYLRGSLSGGVADITFPYGLPGDVPVTGDWDGNGSRTPGVFRGGMWFLRDSNSTGTADLSFPFGFPGDMPVVGDWDGNGTDTIGVFRGGRWYLRNENSEGPADIVIDYGLPGDISVVGDWDGNGTDTIGVFRGGDWYLSNHLASGVAELFFAYGIGGDVPVPGDWDANGVDSASVFRGGRWYVSNRLESTVADQLFPYGIAGDRPLVWR